MNFSEGKSIYLQIADKICDDILNGRHTEGGRIPSVRECAAEVEVNINTVMRSYEYLQQQQVIYTQRGLGYFVCEGAKAAIEKVRRQEFFDDTLPKVVRTMKSLGITNDEVLKYLNDNR